MAQWLTLGTILAAMTLLLGGLPAEAFTAPAGSRSDNLKTPLGIDDAAPLFSWQLQGPAQGARQTADEIEVASQPELLDEDKPDVWRSGRVSSDRSFNVRYGGSALVPGTSYFWCARAWDVGDKAYPVSEIGRWETGPMNSGGWHARWIGYETTEEAAVRRAGAQWIANPDARSLDGDHASEHHFMYRTTVFLAKPVRRAVLYAAGEDTVAGWVNGTNVIVPNTPPVWKMLPWKKYASGDATELLTTGKNVIGVEVIHYVDPNGTAAGDAPPMSATLYVEYKNGTTETFASGTNWKTAIYADAGWMQPGVNVSSWKNAVLWTRTPGPDADPR